MKKSILSFGIAAALFSCSAPTDSDSNENNPEKMEEKNKDFKQGDESTYTQREHLESASGHPVVFYNVENLFDIFDDPNTSDDEFTPQGRKKWDVTKYKKKIDDITKVLTSIGNEMPVIIGLSEVENADVVVDLLSHKDMRNGNYVIVHEESPDNRGIDVAFMHDETRFNYLEHESIRTNFPWGSDIKTRDVLMVKGEFANHDTVYIFVNHWPSRRDGQLETEPKRTLVAQNVRNRIDKILEEDPEAKIMLMGDFNDYPNNKSVSEVIKAKETKDLKDGEFYNLMFRLEKQGLGSHNYRGEWGMLDQIMISKGLTNSKDGIKVRDNKAKVFAEDWVLFKRNTGETSPNKTYGGNKYFGGYSDHLPVYVILK